MTNMSMSREGLEKLTMPWEEFVGYPYDDKQPKRRIDGKLQYPEWTGEKPRGTPTIGFGHTDAAGNLKITVGMRMTQEEAIDLLLRDMAPCERTVNADLKVSVTQHQFDMLCDLDFNCPSALGSPSARGHVINLVNAGNWAAAYRVMLQYVYSKGERMAGLVNRRNAEIAWANTPDDAEEAAVQENFAPKAERAPQPNSIAASKVANAGGAVTAGSGAIGFGAAADWLQSVNQAAEPIKTAKHNLEDLGLIEHVAALLHSPAVLMVICGAIAALGVFIILDRRSKLANEHI